MQLRRLFFASVTVLASACALEPEPGLVVSAERSTFDGDVERAVLRIRGVDSAGRAANGPVLLTAPVGRFLDDVVLVDGFSTATYVCAPSEDAACDGPVRLGAEWNGVFASTVVTVRKTPVRDAVTWRAVSTGTSAALLTLAVAPDGSIWAAGEGGAVAHLVGDVWSAAVTPTTAALRAIAFDADGLPVIAGDDGVLLALRGEAFEFLSAPAAHPFTAVAVAADGSVHVGTSGGAVFSLVGEQLVVESSLPSGVLAMGATGDAAWAVGQGFLAWRTMGVWSVDASPLGVTITGAVSRDDGVLLSGFVDGEARRYGVVVSGPSPSWTSSALSETVLAATQSGAERFAVTASHRLFRQERNGDWTPVETPSAPRALASRGPGDLVVLGAPGVSLLRSP